MKNKILFLSLLLQSTAYASDKKYYSGDEIEVCSSPNEIIHKLELAGSPYFLNYERENSEKYLTIVVWDNDIPKLEINPYTYFDTRNFCVRGKVTLFRDSRQIILNNPNQLFVSKND